MLKSKELAYILRHDPAHYNLTLDTYGWCNVIDLLKNTNSTFEYLSELVNNDTRFFFNDDKTLIKAAHGHTVPVVYTNVQTPPDILYHGTASKYIDSIREKGILRMSRVKVHLSEKINEASNVGGRHGEPYVFIINSKKMYEDGFIFYKSEDGVWLTDDIPTKYIIEK